MKVSCPFLVSLVHHGKHAAYKFSITYRPSFNSMNVSRDRKNHTNSQLVVLGVRGWGYFENVQSTFCVRKNRSVCVRHLLQIKNLTKEAVLSSMVQPETCNNCILKALFKSCNHFQGQH